ncbi:ECF-type sigma factor [Aquimonas voraii]|uniref:RNA polymerase sigma factor, TIGR02999 family n=1 Tax=Aquimonas voraii TaxID=265719 RepID=A0A1G6U4R3_9GAMM|nr:ECF-type sigma factor [Aquimonas voraii]SDD35577.1 RNA polymerase sigma factor, TIGR02999 family [Aquimonas voraii]
MSGVHETPSPPAGEALDALLRDWRSGDPAAADQLFGLLYPELQQLAARALAPHRRGPTLDTGALVQEACLRLLNSASAPQSALHLKAIAAAAMRQIIVDHARRHLAGKRGRDWLQVTFGATVERLPSDQVGPADVVEVDQSLQRLAALGERPVRVVECRFFAGLSEQETAEALGLSRSTVQREWRRAQAWMAVMKSDPGSADAASPDQEPLP